MRRALAMAVLAMGLTAGVARADGSLNEPSPQFIAEAMRACLPITEIHAEQDGAVFLTVDGGLENPSIGQWQGGIGEHYYHWVSTIAKPVTLTFIRYFEGLQRPADGREIRTFRNRVIGCFYSVPDVPKDWFIP